MVCQSLLHDGALMPRGIVNDDHHLGMALRRVGSGNIMQMSHKGHLEPSGFALTGLPFDPSGLFQQSGGEFATRDIEGGVAIDQILMVPGPDRGSMPLDPEGGPKGRREGKTRFVLTGCSRCYLKSEIRIYLYYQ